MLDILYLYPTCYSRRQATWSCLTFSSLNKYTTHTTRAAAVRHSFNFAQQLHSDATKLDAEQRHFDPEGWHHGARASDFTAHLRHGTVTRLGGDSEVIL